MLTVCNKYTSEINIQLYQRSSTNSFNIVAAELQILNYICCREFQYYLFSFSLFSWLYKTSYG